LDFVSASSLKQGSAGKHIVPHYPNLKPTSLCSYSLMMLSQDAANTSFEISGLTRPQLKVMIYHIRGEQASHYFTDAVRYLHRYTSVT
jgi:hypothetical protein